MTLPKTQTKGSVFTALEAVPPLLRQGEAGIEAVIEKVRAVHEAVGLDGVNIPEIREESSKSDKGERIKPFEPRVEPREIARRIKESVGIDCMINRVVVHLPHDQQADWFRETYEEYGVREFVLVGGERSDVDYPGPRVPEANEMIRKVITDPKLRVGNICIPGRENEGARMARKMGSGADFFTTQIVYHASEFTGLLDELKEVKMEGEPPSLLLTVCPVKSARNIKFLHWLGVSMSQELEAWLVQEKDQVAERSVEHIRNTWAEIQRHAATTGSRFPIGVSLAPIGKIPNSLTIELAESLVSARTAVA
ncbi:methylenetetrahydrofolate reductase [Ectothiorhodospiraceae bacterium WFHF3C12]|nr:methylenetetrahydrofolate reductase [Ectothiorhodospiraceae bacterium WFHF3C12]